LCPLVATARNRTARFRVSGRDVWPPEWNQSPPSQRQRRKYFAILAVELWHQKQASLAAGEDRHGEPLVDVKRPRKGTSDWHGRPYRQGSGPPLAPYRSDSRVRNLLRVRSDTRSATVYWVAAPLGGKRKPGWPKTFPELLVIHANGSAGVIRDVIGLPDARLLLAVERAVRRWRLGKGPRPMELPPTSRLGATRRQSSRPEPDTRNRVRTTLGRGAREGIVSGVLGRGPLLVQRIAGVFGF
jgi:hypothetical protein